MALYVFFDYRIAYWLLGAILFFIPRFVNSFDFWGLQKKTTPKIDWPMFFYYIIGGVFVMFTVGDMISLLMYTTPQAIFSNLLLELVPDILLLIVGFIFISDAFIEPTKNSLITLLIVTVVSLPVAFILFHNPFIADLFLYSYIIGPVVGIVVGMIIGVFLHWILNNKATSWNHPVYNIEGLWKVTNNTWILGILMVVCVVEVLFQLQGLTMIFPLTQLI